MIVEFTGCSGAGKTTLLRYVRGSLAHLSDQRERTDTPYRPVEPYEHFVRRLPHRLTRPLRRRCAVSTHWANLTVELFGWPSVQMGRRRFAECDRWVRAKIRQAALNRREQLRLVRSWNRKLAVMAGCFPEYGEQQVSRCLLQDEGVVHFATTLLARVPGPLSPLLDEYFSLVPLPDRIVMVTTSSHRAENRLSRRNYKPAPDRRGADRQRILARASVIVDAVAEHPRLVPRFVWAPNDSDKESELQTVADHVVNDLKLCGRGQNMGAHDMTPSFACTVATGSQLS